MKKKYLFLVLPLIIIFLTGSKADFNFILEKQLESAEKSGFTENIPETAVDTLEKIGINGLNYEKLLTLSFKDIIEVIWSSFLLQIKEPLYFIISIFAAALICALAECFCEEFSQSKIVIRAVSSVCAALCLLMPMKNLINYSAKVIEECSDFMIGFIPIYSSAITATGYLNSAAGFHTLMLSVSAVISRFAAEIIVPLILIYFALSISESFSEVGAGNISKAVKSFTVWVLTFLMTAFSGIMGLGTLVSSSADGTLSKTTRFLIGNSIPVVGSTISDTLSTVKGCLNLTKNVLGVYAVIVIAAIFLPPIINLICWRICLFLSSAVCSVFENKNLLGIISSASCVMGIMLALVSITAVIFIFSVTIMLLATGGS